MYAYIYMFIYVSRPCAMRPLLTCILLHHVDPPSCMLEDSFARTPWLESWTQLRHPWHQTFCLAEWVLLVRCHLPRLQLIHQPERLAAPSSASSCIFFSFFLIFWFQNHFSWSQWADEKLDRLTTFRSQCQHHHPSPRSPENSAQGLWFLVCYATTQLATQLRQRCIQVVRSNKEARKRLTESSSTPAMDPGHMNVDLTYTWDRLNLKVDATTRSDFFVPEPFLLVTVSWLRAWVKAHSAEAWVRWGP